MAEEGVTVATAVGRAWPRCSHGCSSSVLVCNVRGSRDDCEGNKNRCSIIETIEIGGLASSERVAGSIITIHISHGTIP